VELGSKTLSVIAGDYAGTLNGAGGLAKTGVNTLTLSGVNTYAGATAVDVGVLALTGAGSVSASSVVAVASGAEFNIAQTTARADVLALEGVAGARVQLGAKTLGVGAGAFGGDIAGTGALVKTGTGTLTLSGANTYTGATQIEGGVLALSGAGSVAASTQVELGAQGTLDVSGVTEKASVHALTGVS
jgi:autotransporter-associated beta strand protein